MTTARAEASPPPRRRLDFRPDIEGLRAVAVALVLALHFGVTALAGGYVGVDVFFVISGFLITHLLIDEVRASGGISIAGFYARRARRILPAACLVIAVTVVITYEALGPLAGRSAALDGRWASGFVANVRFIRQGTDYFGSALPPSPLQNYWSLAVEEQFYLVWPTLLLVLVVLGRRVRHPQQTLRLGLVAIVITSLVWSIHQSRVAPTAAYFSPFTRAWELGAGALVATMATTIARIPRLVRCTATWVGLALVLVAGFAFSATTVFPGDAALLPILGSVLVIGGGIGLTGPSAALVLALRPVRWVGRISFSLYLWHWPVIVIAEERAKTPLTNLDRVGYLVLTVALSAATFSLIERPFHTSPFLKPRRARTGWQSARRPLVAGALAVAVALSAAALVETRASDVIDAAQQSAARQSSLAHLIPTQATDATRIRLLDTRVQHLVRAGLALHDVPTDVDPPPLQLHVDPKYAACEDDRTVDPCTFGDTHSARTLVVFGDSHAMEWMPAIDTYAQAAGYRVVALYKLACPVPAVAIFRTTGPFPACSDWRARAMRDIVAMRPSALIMAFGTENTAQGAFDQSAWIQGLRTSLQRLRRSGAVIVEIGNNPALSEDPGLCLTRPHADPTACVGTYQDPALNAAEAQTDRSMAARYVDISPWYCVDNRCPAIIDGRIAYQDHDHLSPQYVRDLEPVLAVALRVAGLR